MMRIPKQTLALYGTATLVSLSVHGTLLLMLGMAGTLFNFRPSVGRKADIVFRSSQNSPLPLRKKEPEVLRVVRPAVPLPPVSDPVEDRVHEERQIWSALRESFKDAQANLDQRIHKLQSHLAVLDSASELRQTPSQGVSWVIPDLGKVSKTDQERLLPGYLRVMRERIAKAWISSLESDQNRKSGTVTVQYHIESSGAVTHLETLYLGSNPKFHQMCLDAVSQAGPLAPLPFQIEADDGNRFLTVQLTFYFKGPLSFEPWSRERSD